MKSERGIANDNIELKDVQQRLLDTYCGEQRRKQRGLQKMQRRSKGNGDIKNLVEST